MSRTSRASVTSSRETHAERGTKSTPKPKYVPPQPKFMIGGPATADPPEKGDKDNGNFRSPLTS